MMSNAFEAAFDAFLERLEYDEAQQARSLPSAARRARRRAAV